MLKACRHTSWSVLVLDEEGESSTADGKDRKKKQTVGLKDSEGEWRGQCSTAAGDEPSWRDYNFIHQLIVTCIIFFELESFVRHALGHSQK